MPDHLHLLLSVEDNMDDILGRKLATFKVMVNKCTNIERVFEKGFNHQILTTTRNLDVIYDYLHNPYRLAIRFAHPDFFSRISRIKIGDKTYSAYGNIHLLSNPFKEQVVFHRADSEAKRKSVRERLLYTSANGGVLVSSFISPTEKALCAEAETLGAKIILIIHEAFPERFKPASHCFD